MSLLGVQRALHFQLFGQEMRPLGHALHFVASAAVLCVDPDHALIGHADHRTGDGLRSAPGVAHLGLRLLLAPFALPDQVLHHRQRDQQQQHQDADEGDPEGHGATDPAHAIGLRARVERGTVGMGSDMFRVYRTKQRSAIRSIGIASSRKSPEAGSGLGDPGRNRTCDRLLRRQMLYPLSYGAGDAKMKVTPFGRPPSATG